MTTAAEATISAINAKMKFTITLTNGLEPTLESDGFIYVVSNGTVVKSSTQTASKQYHSDGAVTVEGLYYENGTSALSYEDAKNLNNRTWKLTITGGAAGANGQLRIAESLTPATGDDSDTARVVNASTDIGYITISANGSSAPTYTYKNRSNEGNALSSFYYAYSPAHTQAAGTTGVTGENIDSAGEVTLAVTATLVEQ